MKRAHKDTSPALNGSSLYDFDRSIAMESAREGFVLAGVDEAGRGPLAGPVVVAAVILPPHARERYAVNDSKALTAAQREELAAGLKSDPDVKYAIVFRSAEDIDRLNILRATHEGMREAASQLSPDLALVDGLKVPNFPVPARFLVKGDARSASIAAASILAKTARDHYMDELDAKYPGYGFAAHKGYGTQAHLAALAKLGPCPEHRRTFAPVANILNPPPAPIQLELPL
ncbi:MAG: ribonuclease HII [Victivallales bacterium]|nr:ribonuclease HII [Victivallales bacterium]